MPCPYETFYLQKDSEKVQDIQCRGTRYVFNRYHRTSSPTEMLTNLNSEPLTTRRAKIKLCTFYKIGHGLVDICSPQYINLTPSRTRRTNDLTYFEISASIAYYQHSFYLSTIVLWRSLPASIVVAPNLMVFKAVLAPLPL